MVVIEKASHGLTEMYDIERSAIMLAPQSPKKRPKYPPRATDRAAVNATTAIAVSNSPHQKKLELKRL
jgi:hypothetical protein